MTEALRNHIGGEWRPGTGDGSVAVTDPATGGTIARAPRSAPGDVDAAVDAALAAFGAWADTPVPTRTATMFRYRQLVWEARDELARIIVDENGKTFAEAQGEVLRALQYVEHAAAATETMKGAVTENVGTGVDSEYIREPLGPFAIVAPFNFPAMIPLYFTWAVACGNPVVVKPSELCPLTAVRLVELATEAGFPAGVVNLVHGDRTVVERLATHPGVVGMSFVGSSDVAERVYRMVTGSSKRCQAQGGSKNHLVVTDSAEIDRCLPNIVSSMLGNSSQRCFAGSNLLVYEAVFDEVVDKFTAAVRSLRLGCGRDEGVALGPVISPAARDGLEAAVHTAVDAGADLVLDGRGATVEGYPDGYWLGPTILRADPGTDVWDRELFGPVRALRPVGGLEEAIEIVNASAYGHTAAVYTEHGGVAREFRRRADVGQVGINVGTPAPIAFYGVGGRKRSFFGSLRGRANDAVDFYTDKKVVVSTWHIDTQSSAAQTAPVDPAFQP